MKKKASDLKKISKLMNKPVALTGDRKEVINEAVSWMLDTVEKL